MKNKIAVFSFSCLTVLACDAPALSDAELSGSALQQSAQQALARAIAKSHAKGGFVVIADAKTGAVLETATAGIEQVPDRIDPASLMKPLLLAVALENELVSADEVLECGPGRSRWDNSPRLSAVDTVALSSNRCTARILERVGAPKFAGGLQALGLTLVPTAAAPAHSPPAYEEDWLAQAGGCVSPAQLLAAYAVIANRGEQAGRPLLRVDTVNAVTRALSLAVTQGTARNARSARVDIAGKTATSLGSNPPCVTGQPMSAFIGFFPTEQPQWVMLTAIVAPEAPVPLGSRFAAPLFRDVVDGAH